MWVIFLLHPIFALPVEMIVRDYLISAGGISPSNNSHVLDSYFHITINLSFSRKFQVDQMRNIKYSSIQSIRQLKSISMNSVKMSKFGQWVQHDLTNSQLQSWHMFDFTTEPFLQWIVANDERGGEKKKTPVVYDSIQPMRTATTQGKVCASTINRIT